MMRLRTATALAALCLNSAWSGPIAEDGLAVEGTVLATAPGDTTREDIVAVTMPGGAQQTLTASLAPSSPDRRLELFGPCFSPDGTRIAFIRAERFTAGTLDRPAIYVMSNDGTGVVKLTDFGWLRPTLYPQSLLTWATDGYIYWSEDTTFAYRVAESGGEPEIVCEFHPSSDQPEDSLSQGNVYALSVSRDGTRAASSSSGGGRLFRYDLTGCNQVFQGTGGCRGVLAPEGDRVLHLAVGYPTANQKAYIRPFGANDVLGYVSAPGVPAGYNPDTIVNVDFANHRFSSVTGDYAVCTGGLDLDGHSYLYEVTTNMYAEVGMQLQPWDFYPGPLPQPDRSPVLSLADNVVYVAVSDTTAGPCLKLFATAPLQDSLTVSLQPDSGWLTVTHTQSSDSIDLCHTANPDGLPTGGFVEYVTVGAQGAANTVVYRVVLNNSVPLVRPTALTARQVGTNTVLLAWEGNEPGVDGYLLERRELQGTWQAAATVEPSQTQVRDSLPATGDYDYRVRAFTGADTSAWSETATVAVKDYPSIVITNPREGDSLTAGSDVRIRWQSVNILRVVVETSTNNGDDWLNAGSVGSTDSLFGNFPWTVPDDTTTSSLLIRLSSYDGHEFTRIGPLAIVADAPVRHTPAGRASMVPARVTRRYMLDGTTPLMLADGMRLVTVCRLDGSHVKVSPRALRNGVPLAAGCYFVTTELHP